MVMTNQGKHMEDNDLDSNDRFKMSAAEFRNIREDDLDLSRREISEIIGTDYETVVSWELERNPVPGPISMLVRILVDINGTEYGEKYGLD